MRLALPYILLVTAAACSRAPTIDDAAARALAEDAGGWSSLAPIPGNAKRGEYLATIGACKECHTLRARDGRLDTTKLFAGGIPFEGSWGVVASANVSMVAGRMPPAQLEDMIRGRLSYKFQMPTELYQQMAQDDMRDLVTYLRTLTPVDRGPPSNAYRAGFHSPEPNPMSAIAEHAPTGMTVERGRYLTTIAICKDCHSPRLADGIHYDEAHLFAGGGLGFRTASGLAITPPNLTPDPADGLGTWTDDEVVRAIRTGVAKDGHQLNPVMPYSVALDVLTDSDVGAIVKYLRSLPAVARSLPPNPSWRPSDPPDACCFPVSRGELDARASAEGAP